MSFATKPYYIPLRVKKNLNREENAINLIDELLRQDVKTPKGFNSEIRSYDEIKKEIEKRIINGQFSDLVTLTRHKMQQHSIVDDPDVNPTNEPDNVDIEDEDLKRKDLAESILLNNKIADKDSNINYLNTLKIFRYFLATNRQGTILSLIALRTLDFNTRDVMQALDDTQGTTMLVNLLSVDDLPVRLASMRVLFKLSTIAYFARMIVHLGGIKVLLENLSNPNDQLKRAAGRILANLCMLEQARRILKNFNGIELIVCLLDENTKEIFRIHEGYGRQIRLAMTFDNHRDQILEPILQRLEYKTDVKRHPTDILVKVLCVALCALSTTHEGRRQMQQAGIVSTFAMLIPLSHTDVLESVMATMQNCCVDKYFRLAVWTEGILPQLIDCLKNAKINVQIPCAETLAQCANDAIARDSIKKLRGLEIIKQFVHWEINSPNGALYNIRKSTVLRGRDFDGKTFTESLLKIKTSEGGMNIFNLIHRDNLKIKSRLVVNKLKPSEPDEASRRSNDKNSKIGIEHEYFLVNLTRLIWKVSFSTDNAKRLFKLGMVNYLVRLIVELPRIFGPFRRPDLLLSEKMNGLDRAEDIVKNSLNALAILAMIPEISSAIAQMESGIKPWIILLRLAIDGLIPATCASMRVLLGNKIMHDSFIAFGGLRLLFATVANKEGETQKQALRTIVKCLEHSEDVGKLLKPLIDSMQIVIKFIASLVTDVETQVAALDCIAQMARDQNILAIMTDLGTVPALARLLSVSYTEDLYISICLAIAACSYYNKNAYNFGEANCMPILCRIVQREGTNTLLRNAAIKALYGLSFEAINSTRIWNTNICHRLLYLATDISSDVQLETAGILANIRKLEFKATFENIGEFESNYHKISGRS